MRICTIGHWENTTLFKLVSVLAHKVPQFQPSLQEMNDKLQNHILFVLLFVHMHRTAGAHLSF